MEDLRYIYSVARVRVLETRLLKRNAFHAMLEADSLSSALKILAEEAVYENDVENLKDSEGIEAFLDSKQKDLDRAAQELFVDPYLYEAYKNLKEDPLKSYELILKSGSAILIDFIKRYIDLGNIKTILRIQKRNKPDKDAAPLLTAGGYAPVGDLLKGEFGRYRDIIKEGIERFHKDDAGLLEFEMDDYLAGLLRPAKHIFFGPEAVFGYCVAKDNEIRQIRMILLGKINNIQTADLKERLTIIYA